MAKLRFDAECDNLNMYFAHQLSKITEEGKDRLPKEILVRLFRKGEEASKSAVSKMGFLEKLYVLVRALKGEWLILVKDERGMSTDQFNHLKEKLFKKSGTIEDAEMLFSTGEFVLADKELFDAYKQINGLSISAPYNYVSKIKNMPPSRTAKWRQKSQFLVRFLVNYETNKKRINLTSDLTLPELYVLMALYHGKEVTSSTLYKETLKGCYNANRSQIQRAFILLKSNGFVERIGNPDQRMGVKLRITNAGISKIDDIMQKYIVNF